MAILRFLAVSVIGFMFPRFLIGCGVPIDEWAISLGEGVGMAFSSESAVWGVSIILAVLLTGVEAWFAPLKRLWQRLFGGKIAKNARRDVSLRQAVFYCAYKVWDEAKGIEEMEKEEFAMLDRAYEAARLLLQAALDGEITIWGRYGFSPKQHEIPQDYWEYHSFDQMFFLKDGGENWKSEKTSPERTNYPIYTHLMTSRAQVEELCRVENF